MKMKSFGKKTLALLLAFVFVFACIPAVSLEADAAATLIWPVPGHTNLSRDFYQHGAKGSIDIQDSTINGAPIVAAMSGKVVHISLCTVQHVDTYGDCGGFGTGIAILGDDGRYYSYAHMTPYTIPSNVYYGAYVQAGQHIGNVGTTGMSSGPHLHFHISTGSGYASNGPDPMQETYRYISVDQIGGNTEPLPPVETTVTQEQALSWAESQSGVALDMDGDGLSDQDLIYYYYQYLGAPVHRLEGNEYIYSSLALPSNWQRISVTDGFVAQPGDIGVLNANNQCINGHCTDSKGHVVIIRGQNPNASNQILVMEQQSSCPTYAGWYHYSDLACVIRPAFHSEHLYDNACDTTCDTCGETRVVAGHAYDNACDTTCNICGETRVVAGHAYSNDCDTTCNTCGALRSTGPHIYDDDLDATCNECGFNRNTETPIVCFECNFTIWDMNATHHWMKCPNCGNVNSSTREVHQFDNACDTTCNVCGETRNVSGHAWGSWIQTTPPEIGKKGEETRTCANCGTTEKRDVDALQPEYDAKAIFSSAVVRPGEEFEVLVSFEKMPNLVGIAVEDLEFDREKFELVSGEWIVSNTTLNAWWINDERGVCAFSPEKDCNGGFFRFVFRAKDGVEDGTSQFKCSVIARAKIEGVEQIIPMTVVPAEIEVRNVLVGDMDGDGVKTIDDAIYLLFAINFPNDYAVNQKCDFDGDGVKTIDDAIYLLFAINFPDDYPLH